VDVRVRGCRPGRGVIRARRRAGGERQPHLRRARADELPAYVQGVSTRTVDDLVAAMAVVIATARCATRTCPWSNRL
jgi:hypothetical protein